MHRRSLLHVFTKLLMGIPFIPPVANMFARDVYNGRTRLSPGTGSAITEGIGFGIPELDTAVNGVQKGELAIVYSPLDTVSIAFLINTALHAALDQSMKVDYVVSQANERPYIERALNRVSPGERKSILSSIYGTANDDALLRIRCVELGLPSVDGWKEYCGAIANDPPGAIIMDGVELIEIMLDETTMVEQLKALAVALSVPVLVHVPINRTIYTDDDIAHPREDFNKLADILIGLKPLAVSKYKERGTYPGRYIFLETHIMTGSTGGRRPHYFITIDVDYNEWYGEFG